MVIRCNELKLQCYSLQLQNVMRKAKEGEELTPVAA